MNINNEQTKGCDRMSQVYGNTFNALQEIMQDDEKLKSLSPLDFSAMGLYIGKFVEQEINSSVVQLMRSFRGIDMPDYYCKRYPRFDVDADIKFKNKIVRLNEQKPDNKDLFSLRTISLGDAYYALQELKEEDEDNFFDQYPWLNDAIFLEAWRKLFRFRNRMAHIGEIIDVEILKENYVFFQRFLKYMPQILDLKKELAPDEYIETIPAIKEKKIEEEKPYWTTTDHRDKPYASIEIAQRFCELNNCDWREKDYYEKMEERNAISEKYYLDAKIFDGENGKKGLKDCLGNILVPANYDGFYFLPRILEHPNTNVSVIAIRNKKYVVTTLDGSGKELTNREYDDIRLARNDHPYMTYIYRKDGALSWGFMSNQGKELTECIIDSLGLGLNSFVYESGGLQGYWQFGYDILPPIYDNIEMVDDFDDPLLFTLNGEQGYVRHDGYFLSLKEIKRQEEEDEGEEINRWDFFCEEYEFC